MKVPCVLTAISVLWFVHFGCASPEKTVGVRVSKAPMPDWQSWPEISQYLAVVVDANELRVVSWGKSGTEKIVTLEEHGWIDRVAVHHRTGRIAYSRYSNVRQHCLCLTAVNGGLTELFKAPQTIHSLSWSVDGKRLAFVVGECGNFGRWYGQRLYVVILKDESKRPIIEDLGKIDLQASGGMQGAPHIIWSQSGKSLFWVGREKCVTQYDLMSRQHMVHGKAERLYLADKEKLLVARSNPPWLSMWRLVWIPINGEEEDKIIEFQDVEDMGRGLLVPETPILSVAVREQMKPRHSKNPWIRTVFINIKSGKMIGRIDFPVVGYIRIGKRSPPLDHNPGTG